MIELIIITDYFGRFETKVPVVPYHSGLDRHLLSQAFNKHDINVRFKTFAEIANSHESFKEKIFVYTSLEDYNLYYKSFIEDVIWGLKLHGAIVVPDLIFLRAHHNKVFMELLRTTIKFDTGIKSYCFGTLEELNAFVKEHTISYPVVIKGAHGAGSKFVRKANHQKELIKYAKQLSHTHTYKALIIENLLSLKKYFTTGIGFRTDTVYRKKIIVQNYIPGLRFDWKVLIFGEKYYVLKRFVLKNDFRASGSGKFQTVNDNDLVVDANMLDFAKSIYVRLNVPNLSLDIAFDGIKYFLIEFQAISFGTFTQTNSDSYFTFEENTWNKIRKKYELEEVYAESVAKFIKSEMLQ